MNKVHDRVSRGSRPVTDFSVPKDAIDHPSISKTKQSFAIEADINNIMARAKKTGFLVDPLKPLTRKALFGDFSDLPDFSTMQDRLAKINNEFSHLPADVRLKFENDPSNLIEFLADPANKQDAIKLGLWPKPVRKNFKEETPEGNFWVTTEDEIEVSRVPVVPVKAAAVAPESSENW